MSFITANKSFAHVAKQGGGNPAPSATPAVTAPLLERALPRVPLPCTQCGQQVLPVAEGYFANPFLATIMWLPHTDHLPPTSMVRHPDHGINEGASNHPCVPALMSACGHLTFCLPVTSFGGHGVEGKYCRAANPQEFYDEYLPLAERDTRQTNNWGALAYDGTRMRNQSYL